MAKNVTIAGAAYSAVPSIDVPQTGGGTASFFDVSDTTATAADVAQGKVFYAADGTATTGTASGGGGSSWTHIWHTERTLQNTGTTSQTFYLTVEDTTGKYADKGTILYIRIRDMAGPRAGYFFGTDSIVISISPTASTCRLVSTFEGLSDSGGVVITSSSSTQSPATTSYGVFLNQPPTRSLTENNLRIGYRARSNSWVVDGTFSIDVFAADSPTGYPLANEELA